MENQLVQAVNVIASVLSTKVVATKPEIDNALNALQVVAKTLNQKLKDEKANEKPNEKANEDKKNG